MHVAALFVDPKGIYPHILPSWHCWDEERDARTYRCSWPVVAHPPCQLWGNFAAANWGRYKRQRPAWLGGDDGGCFKSALDNVMRCGGVLEHPASSHAFAFYGIDMPRTPGWTKHGGGGYPYWTCIIAQSAYGHKCEKLTGIVYSGVRPPFEMRLNRPKGTHQIGYHDKRGKANNKPTVSKKEANATPMMLAHELISLAHWSAG